MVGVSGGRETPAPTESSWLANRRPANQRGARRDGAGFPSSPPRPPPTRQKERPAADQQERTRARGLGHSPAQHRARRPQPGRGRERRRDQPETSREGREPEGWAIPRPSTGPDGPKPGRDPHRRRFPHYVSNRGRLITQEDGLPCNGRLCSSQNGLEAPRRAARGAARNSAQGAGWGKRPKGRTPKGPSPAGRPEDNPRSDKNRQAAGATAPATRSRDFSRGGVPHTHRSCFLFFAHTHPRTRVRVENPPRILCGCRFQLICFGNPTAELLFRLFIVNLAEQPIFYFQHGFNLFYPFIGWLVVVFNGFGYNNSDSCQFIGWPRCC